MSQSWLGRHEEKFLSDVKLMSSVIVSNFLSVGSAEYHLVLNKSFFYPCCSSPALCLGPMHEAVHVCRVSCRRTDSTHGNE